MPLDMIYRAVHAIDQSDGQDRVEIFRVPIFRACRIHTSVQGAHFIASPQRATCVTQGVQDGRGVAICAVNQKRFGRPANAGAAHLGVYGNCQRLGGVSRLVDIGMTNSIEMGEYGDARIILDAFDQRLATARDDDVDQAARRQHRADAGSVCNRHELDGISGQATGDDAFNHRGMNGPAGVDRFRSAPQDDGIARHQAQRACVGGDIGATFINDADDAQRHADAFQHQPVGPFSPVNDRACGVRQAGNRFNARRNAFQTHFIQRQPVKHCSCQTVILTRCQIDGIGRKDRWTLHTNGGRRTTQSLCFVSRRGTRHDAGGGACARSHVGNQGVGRLFDIAHNVARLAQAQCAAKPLAVAGQGGYHISMTEGLESAADAMTGAVIARAVEPDAGEAGAHDGKTCLNCGETLNGKHCHACGQAGHVHRTLGAFWHDFTHSILHFEGKFWRTLPLLAFKPGLLTRRYIDGERARFVSPLAAFLFSVFLLFAAINWLGGPLSPTVKGKTENGVSVDFSKDMRQSIAKAKAELVELERTKAPAAKIAEKRDELRQMARAGAFADGIDAEDFKAEEGDFQLGNPALEAKLRHGFENPQLLFYKMQSSAYKFSWAIIPLSLPFVWLLFAWKRRFNAYDHLVFITYSLTFMGLFLVVLSILGRLGPLAALRDLLFAIVPPLHMLVHVKGTYELTWFSAIWRTVVLVMVAVFVMIVFTLLLLALGIA
jgi:hypothetical protein